MRTRKTLYSENIRKRSNASNLFWKPAAVEAVVVAPEMVRYQNIHRTVRSDKVRFLGSAAPVVDQEAIEEEKRKLRDEYQAQMEALKQQYQAEQSSKAQLQAEMKKLKEQYDESVAKVQQQGQSKSGFRILAVRTERVRIGKAYLVAKETRDSLLGRSFGPVIGFSMAL